MQPETAVGNKKQKHILFSVCAVFALGLTACLLLSFALHIRMLAQIIAGTSQVACGHATQTIAHGLSYGKEISNYSGMDELLNSSVALVSELKNVYVCDTNGVIFGSYIKMLDDTTAKKQTMMSYETDEFNIRLEGSEMHILQALQVDGQIMGFVGVVTDAKAVLESLAGQMQGEIDLALLIGGLMAVLVVLVLTRSRIPASVVYSLFAVVCMVLTCTLHLTTQRTLLDTELARQSQVLAATINADIERLNEKGINISEMVGYEAYLSEKLELQDTISMITLEDKVNGQRYTAENSHGIQTSHQNVYEDSKFFTISVGIGSIGYSRYNEYSIWIWITLLIIIEISIITWVYMNRE